MNQVKIAIYFITTGMTLGFALIIYAHSNFSTKEAMQRLIENQKEKEAASYKREDRIIKRLDRIELKIDDMKR